MSATLGGGAGSHTVLNGAIVQKGKIVEQSLAAFPDLAEGESNFDLYAPDILLHGYDGVEPCNGPFSRRLARRLRTPWKCKPRWLSGS